MEDRRSLWHAVADAAGVPGQHVWALSVCRNCVTAVPGVDAAAVTLRATETAQDLLGASDDWAAALEDQQYTLGEGPGMQAFRTREPVLVDSLDIADQHWPGFTDAAQTLGMGAAFAFPLQFGAIILGTLDLYRRTPGTLAGRARADAAALADLITLALLRRNEQTHVSGENWLPGMGSYHDVNIATGMLAARLGISLGDAFTRLRGHAFLLDRTVLELARDVIAHRIDVDDLGE
ncbi:GAF and ANTAR domain-containing protein [Rhodococcus koreensis]|uniref:GAF and ANTAR domain-containing protein n=1 Tax=Rhodococcus koreensis TaxID=99653 RepID=UPI001F128899|nr:GAF and ANTAR domain-containing protein [Rhodococcus koreensis]